MYTSTRHEGLLFSGISTQAKDPSYAVGIVTTTFLLDMAAVRLNLWLAAMNAQTVTVITAAFSHVTANKAYTQQTMLMWFF